jgi:hypothetical protein
MNHNFDMKLFTPSDRDKVQLRILEMAQSESCVTGGAVLGSIAAGTQDRWSDLDITFAVSENTNLIQILDNWTQVLDKEFAVLHHFDLRSGPSIYRVILFANCLELDLSVTSEAEFRPRGSHFKLLFGNAKDIAIPPAPSEDELIGLCWHHILHANSAIARGKFWQAEYWISALRNYALSLLCLRLGLATSYGKGIDLLPHEILKTFEAGFVQALNPSELKRSLTIVSKAFCNVLLQHHEVLAKRLAETLLLVLTEENQWTH